VFADPCSPLQNLVDPVRVIYVSTEIYPALKTGGLADVNAALPKALRGLGVDVRVLLPAYPALLQAATGLRPVAHLRAAVGATATATDVRVLSGSVGGVPAYLIEADKLYARPGNPYVDGEGRDWPDNHLQFALLGWVAAHFADAAIEGWRPDIVHGHDWHAGLAPAYLAARGGERPASVFTVHNLAYQGEFPAAIFNELALPAGFFSMHGVEFHGRVNYMKSGLHYADRITTVSPTYAREIQTPEYGFGMDGVLRSRAGALSGILNGVDSLVWYPQTDAAIAAPYTMQEISGKVKCKAALRAEFGLAAGDGPVFCVISRLTEQKGMDLVLDVLADLIERGGQLVLLGSGDASLEARLRQAAVQYPAAMGVRLGYDELLAHRIIAGSDVILVPSRFEPCGLTQMYGLTYGTLPLVHRVGGLADTVCDANADNLAAGTATGFTFEGAHADELLATVARAFALWAQLDQWEKVRRVAMSQHCGWETSAPRYLDLYRELRPLP
jgi:starch synthase